MACKYVKEFDFSPYKAGGHVKPVAKADGYDKKASGGVLVGPPTSVAPGHAMAKGGKSCNKGGATCKAKGGIIEKATGEKYPSRKEMIKHERSESPRERKEEMVRTSEIKGNIPAIAQARPMPAPARKRMPVAPQGPLIALKEGGKIPKVAQAKVGKVMGEYKEGKLHAGSKKGPEVTNPKQAIAIALSEARKKK
jgi:hypothetical protein